VDQERGPRRARGTRRGAQVHQPVHHVARGTGRLERRRLSALPPVLVDRGDGPRPHRRPTEIPRFLRRPLTRPQIRPPPAFFGTFEARNPKT